MSEERKPKALTDEQHEAIRKIRDALVAARRMGVASVVLPQVDEAIAVTRALLADHIGDASEKVAKQPSEPTIRGASIKKSHRHDGGAYARCSYCGLYSDNPKSLSRERFPCDCGQLHGWCGSFVKPTAESKWSEADVMPRTAIAKGATL